MLTLPFGGDLQSSVKGLVASTGRSIFCRSGEGIYTRPRESAGPDWIERDESTVLARERDGRRATYRPIYTNGDAVELSVNPEWEFEHVCFDIVDVPPEMDVSVTAHFETVGGERSECKLHFRNGTFNEERIVPVTVSSEKPAERAEISIIPTTSGDDGWSFVERKVLPHMKGGSWTYRRDRRPSLSVPTTDRQDSRRPIFLLSIDTFRYDYLDAFEAVRDALGPTVVVPDEPRAQGTSTWPSHASMLTGTLPGTHGCCGGRTDAGISPELPTLPERLAEEGYRCSGIVSCGNLLPERGFARGFHRYEYEPMSWTDRAYDASSIVRTATDWMETDFESSVSQFYFLHFFDAHYPYLPPFPLRDDGLDIELVESFLEQGSVRDYRRLLTEDPLDISPEMIETVRSYYRRSLGRLSDRLVRLFDAMKRLGVFEDALIVVTGDHGEDFYERNFILHHSVYDTNIRPGMIVKPPAGSDLEVPADPDLIDLFPTMLDIAGGDAHDAIEGQSWKTPTESHPRISEQFGDWYTVSVEQGDAKGIFTYPDDSPSRPDADTEPVETEFYSLDAVRDGDYGRRPDSETRAQLEKAAVQFLRSTGEPRASQGDAESLPSDVTERLERLGYK